MLKKFKPKNGRAFRWPAIFFIVVSLAVCVLFSYLNSYLVLNIFPFLSSTTNTNSMPTFYGENIDMSQILPTSQYYVVNSKGQDLIDIAANLGINLVRVTNVQRSFNNDADSVYTRDQWNQVLSKMQRKGIKALILIDTDTNNADYYAPDIRPVYLHLVQEYIDSGVFANPDVYGVDIKNEPLLTDANLDMLQAAHAMIKAKYPDLKQTVGAWATPPSTEDPYNPHNYIWSDFSAGQKLANIVDFYSIHMYGLDSNNSGIGLNPDLRTKVFISEVQKGLQTTKPILIEEFGEANGDAVSDQDTIGSPELQANVYQGVYQALKEIHSTQVLGALAFDFYSHDHYPDAWAIVKNNGNYLFPAAYILQEHALGRNNPSLQEETSVTSQSYLVTNADNDSTKTLLLSDRIGLKLQLDTSKDYSLSLSVSSILQPAESFYYDPDSDSYEAVYQVISKGNVQLNVISNSTGSMDNTPTASEYTLAINVD